jgi:AI-2E family transporter
MDQNPEARNTYLVIAFALTLVTILCTASFVIVRPFLAPLLWGLILAIATWPAFTWWREFLGGRNTLAAALMTLLLALVLLGPLAVIGMAMTENVAALGDRLRAAIQGGLAPPEFLANVPLIGPRLTERWQELAADGKLSDEARQMLRTALQWLLGVGAALGGGIAQLTWRHGLRLHRHLSGADDPRDLVHVDERMEPRRVPSAAGWRRPATGSSMKLSPQGGTGWHGERERVHTGGEAEQEDDDQPQGE